MWEQENSSLENYITDDKKQAHMYLNLCQIKKNSNFLSHPVASKRWWKLQK